MNAADVKVTDGIREIVRRHLEEQGIEMVDAAELDPDGEFERVIELTLSAIPELAGRVAGDMLAQVLSYGRHCGWDTEAIEDSRTFLTRFEEGFAAGLAHVTPEWGDDRAKVIEHFEKEACLMTKCVLGD